MNLISSRISARCHYGAGHLANHGHGPRRQRVPTLSPRTETYTDPMAKFKAEHDRMKKQAMRIDPIAIANAPKVRESSLATPWKTVTVSDDEIAALAQMAYPFLHRGVIYDIGTPREVSNTNPFDAHPRAAKLKLQTRKPGEGIFNGVASGPYGQREFKYLYVVDADGMHIVRELTPCKVSSRGVALHSLMKYRGVLGGEIFFDDENPRVATINFGSARLTFRNAEEADRTARFVVSLGYDKVIAVYPDRDFSQVPYGMKDRYGEALSNAVYVRASL